MALRAVPAGPGGRLPRQVDQVGPALTRPAELGQAAAYLGSAVTAATHDAYLTLALTAVATLAGALVIVSPEVRHHARGQCQRRAWRPGRSGRAAPSAGRAREARPVPSSGEILAGGPVPAENPDDG